MHYQGARFIDADLEHIRFGDCRCNGCRRCHDDGMHCEASPGGIPSEILPDRATHYTPYPGDSGIRFEPRPAASGA